MPFFKLTYHLNVALFASCLGLLTLGLCNIIGPSADYTNTPEGDSLFGSSEVYWPSFVGQVDHSKSHFLTSSNHSANTSGIILVGYEEENISEDERNLRDGPVTSDFLRKDPVGSGDVGALSRLLLPFIKDRSLTLLSTVVFLH